MIGRPHAGVLPIRGHSNVQGLGTVGVTPKLRDAIFERLQNHFGVKLPTSPGYDTIAAVEAAARGEIKFAMCLGGNLFGSNPDAAFAARAMGKIEQVVYLNTTLNTGHAHGLGRETIILPVLARDEEPEPTTQESMFSYVRLSDGGPRRHEGPKSEVEIVADLAARVLPGSGPIDWSLFRSASRIREAIASIVPGLEKIGDLDRTKNEFVIPGRAFHTPAFPTADGKARLHVHELPELAGADASTLPLAPGSAGGRIERDSPSGQCALRLMTIRSEGQFNTVVYEDYDLYRGVEGRDAILMHPDDIASRGLRAGQRVCVRSDAGKMNNILVHEFADIRAGNAAMYYPEANVLVPRIVDPQSKTPVFKSVLVTVEAMPKGSSRDSNRTGWVGAAGNGAHADPDHVAGQPQLVQVQAAPGAKSTRDQMRAC
jgi:anaerobic selenocysteine-containing dehydrogenase